MEWVLNDRPPSNAARQLAIELARLLARDLARAELRKRRQEATIMEMKNE